MLEVGGHRHAPSVRFCYPSTIWTSCTGWQEYSCTVLPWIPLFWDVVEQASLPVLLPVCTEIWLFRLLSIRAQTIIGVGSTRISGGSVLFQQVEFRYLALSVLFSFFLFSFGLWSWCGSPCPEEHFAQLQITGLELCKVCLTGILLSPKLKTGWIPVETAGNLWWELISDVA